MTKYIKGLFKNWIDFFSNSVFFILGFSLCCISMFLAGLSTYNTFVNFSLEAREDLISYVSYLVISVAIFDVGRYLVEEEVLRDRELRSPKEARQSITKFMVIIVIAVTLEALLHLLQVHGKLRDLIYPALLLFVSAILLVSLGCFQRLSASTERDVAKNGEKT